MTKELIPRRIHTWACDKCGHPITMDGESSQIVHVNNGQYSMECKVEGCKCSSPREQRVYD